MNRSLLAGVNALYRMDESARPKDERILDDPWAATLAERALRVQLIRYGRFVVPGLHRAIDELQTTHCVRHRAVDELVLQAVERDGCTQVVVLGAGYDMRPHRFAERLARVRWIEIDHPGTQAHKIALLREVHALLPGKVERQPGDLSKDALEPLLGRTSFDPQARTCFVAEGLLHYLPREAVERLFRAMAVSPGAFRRVVFSTIDTGVFNAAKPILTALIRGVREFPLLHFSLEEVVSLCHQAGLSLRETWTLPQQIAAFAPMAAGRQQGPSQHLALAELPTRALDDPKSSS